MLLYPDVQRLAQMHIDKVIGGSRMPTMDDEEDLPYVRCLMKETLSECYQGCCSLLPFQTDPFRFRMDANHDLGRGPSCYDVR